MCGGVFNPQPTLNRVAASRPVCEAGRTGSRIRHTAESVVDRRCRRRFPALRGTLKSPKPERADGEHWVQASVTPPRCWLFSASQPPNTPSRTHRQTQPAAFGPVASSSNSDDEALCADEATSVLQWQAPLIRDPECLVRDWRDLRAKYVSGVDHLRVWSSVPTKLGLRRMRSRGLPP